MCSTAKEKIGIIFPPTHLGEVDIEEEGLLGVGDLDAVLLVLLRPGTGTGRSSSARDAEVVHGLGDLLHRRRREETRELGDARERQRDFGGDGWNWKGSPIAAAFYTG